jgi:hypothetical protein
MRNVVLKNITDKADKLANEYNKTKDPGLRDQWFKLVRQVGSLVSEEEQTASRKKTLGKVRIGQESL